MSNTPDQPPYSGTLFPEKEAIPISQQSHPPIIIPHNPRTVHRHLTERNHRRSVHDAKRASRNHRLILILDDLDFGWTQDEINLFTLRWNVHQPLETIAALLRPDLTPEDARDETALLALHLLRKGAIRL